MSDNRLLPAAVVGGLLAVGFIGAGALIGQGVIHARAGDRTVTVRGLSERNVKADLAVLPLRFTASGDVLSEVQTKIDGDLALVRRFLTAQGYPARPSNWAGWRWPTPGRENTPPRTAVRASSWLRR